MNIKNLSRPLALVCLVICCSVFPGNPAWATHAATISGEMEGRPAPVFRRICLAGTSAGEYCKQDSECPGSACADRNVFNITVAILFDANDAQINTIQTLISAGSAVLMDVTDGQAEIGTATIHNNAMSTANADFVVHPATNDTGFQALSGHYRTGGFMEVSINRVTDPANQGPVFVHEFVHLVFDARDEYEARDPNCGAVDGGASCPVAASGVASGLMDRNGTELCWGQGDPTDLTDVSGGDHDPTNVTEQSSCRNNRSVWSQVIWSWPTTFLQPTGAPLADAGGAAANPVNFILTEDTVRVVLVLDESGSMSNESPSRMQRLQVAASDFIVTAENGTEVGIVSYSTDADPSNGHASIPVSALGADRSDWTDAITSLSPGGWTSIGDALRNAEQLIVDAGGVTANTYIVLMTDGINNRPSPQATADDDLDNAVADLLASNIPVYVTCTGGDFGVQSQCVEIANGTNGFNSDSSNASRLPANFVEFHERITGHAAIDSLRGNFAEMPGDSKRYFVDEGSESASFALLWDVPQTKASMWMIAPDGTTVPSDSIPQGAYVRIAEPQPGEWTMRIDPSGQSNANFIARGYVRNKINSLRVSLRHGSVKPNEEMYIYAVARSLGGIMTNEPAMLTAEVTLPDGSQQSVDLFDNGRDAAGHGDDLAGDGIYTGVFTATATEGAYGVRVQSNIEGWHTAENAHDADPASRSPRFSREAIVSGAVWDPANIETTPEDDPGSPDDPDDKRIIWLLYIVVILLLLLFILLWRCCYRQKAIVVQ